MRMKKKTQKFNKKLGERTKRNIPASGRWTFDVKHEFITQEMARRKNWQKIKITDVNIHSKVERAEYCRILSFFFLRNEYAGRLQ